MSVGAGVGVIVGGGRGVSVGGKAVDVAVGRGEGAVDGAGAAVGWTPQAASRHRLRMQNQR